ncbi:inorganic diphosphatase [Dechloromonas sp. XY25]|uniref:inorganic diphosphatase n=1 Tax=Dechloromonas hankyongensis TaxID=2908002 RepID=A0ABS9K6B5_9RHOO|nr:inorganic diphosphatase [Dechloromonas hankyongensis]MCG2578716.1 inorganic diphosphatase [Dechloromonas hankyongensis]
MSFDQLPPFRDDGAINVVVETSAGSRCKLKYEAASGAFALGRILPEGFVFPFDFGFVPGTRAEDGDPVDILLVAEAGTAPGCVVPARPIGALTAEQSAKQGRRVRNDRILAVPLVSRQYATLCRLRDMAPALREQIAFFLTSYGVLDGKNLRITGQHGPNTAVKLIRQALK